MNDVLVGGNGDDPAPGDIAMIRLGDGSVLLGEVASIDTRRIVLSHPFAVMVVGQPDGRIGVALAPASPLADPASPMVIERSHVSAWMTPDHRAVDQYTQARAARSGIAIPKLVLPGTDKVPS